MIIVEFKNKKIKLKFYGKYSENKIIFLEMSLDIFIP